MESARRGSPGRSLGSGLSENEGAGHWELGFSGFLCRSKAVGRHRCTGEGCCFRGGLGSPRRRPTS